MKRVTTRRPSLESTRRFYIGGTALLLTFATAAFAADAPPVGPKAETPMVAKSPETTTQRLLDADKEQQNWITHHKNYSAQRFSTLDQINAGNVKDLKVAWTMQLGGVEGGGGQGLQQPLAGGEVAVQGGRGHAGGLSDIGHAG